MKLKITLLLEAGDRHPATCTIKGSKNIVLNSETLGHVEVNPDDVTIGTVTQSKPYSERNYKHDT